MKASPTATEPLPCEYLRDMEMTRKTALTILALIICVLPVICVYAWATDMSNLNLNVLVAIQTVIYVGWFIHCKMNFK